MRRSMTSNPSVQGEGSKWEKVLSGFVVNKQGLLLWLLQGASKVSSGTIYLYRSSYDTSFAHSEIASPDKWVLLSVRFSSLDLRDAW